MGRLKLLKPWLSRLPDDAALTSGLNSILAGPQPAPVTIINRAPNPHASSFPSEIVTCRLGGGEEVRLFCKYEIDRDNRAHGHRGGVPYEAQVYRQLLAPLGLSVPEFRGAVAGGANGKVWLVLGYLERSLRLRDSHDLHHWERAAAWIGRFHAICESQVKSSDVAFLNVYDADYYGGWARRTAEYAGPYHLDFPWLADLCARLPSALGELSEAPRCIVHGEYYSKNLLINNSVISPVDWESTAIAPGEIDLATLTDGCDADMVARCENAYTSARWPNGTPSNFTRVLALARLYVHLRWLGDEPGRKMRRRAWRYEEVSISSKRLRLL